MATAKPLTAAQTAANLAAQKAALAQQAAAQAAAQQKAQAQAAAVASQQAAAQAQSQALTAGQAFAKQYLNPADQAAIAKLPAAQQTSTYQQLGATASQGPGAQMAAYNKSIAPSIPGTTAYATAQAAAKPAAPVAPAAPTAAEIAAQNLAAQQAANAAANAKQQAANQAAQQTAAQQFAQQQADAAAAKQAATTAAQAKFSLPTGNDNTTTTQTVTDPSGSSYTYVPADPTTNTPGQWYKSSGGGMQAVDAKGNAQANAPVVPTTTFQKQLNTTQTDVTNYAQQQAQTSAVNAFNASPEEQAYQQALTAYQNAGSADPATQVQLAQKLQAASDAVNKTYGSGQYTAGLAQQQTGAAGKNLMAAQNAVSAQQEAAQQAAEKQAAAATQAKTDNSAMSTIQQDLKTLGPAATSLLGTYNSPQDAITNAQNAYQTALTAYQNNKNTDPAVKAQLAQNLNQAAELNRTVTGDLAANYPAAAQNAASAQTALEQAQTTNQQAQNAVSAQQEAASVAASQASRAPAPEALTSALSGINNFVKSSIPGGWAGVAAGALLAVGITNPELLGMADSGTLTDTALANAGVDPATVSTALQNGVASGSIPSTEVGLTTEQAATVAPAAETTGATTGAVTPEAAGAGAGAAPVAPEAAGAGAGAAPAEAAPVSAAPTAAPVETTPVAPSAGPVTETALPPATTAPVAPTAAAPTTAAASNTLPVTLPDGSVGTYNLTTGETLDATGAQSSLAPQMPTPGPGTQVAEVTPGTGGYNATGTTWTDASGQTYPVQNGAVRVEVGGVGTEPGVAGGTSELSPVTQAATPAVPEGATSISQVTPVDVTGAVAPEVAAPTAIAPTTAAALSAGALAAAAAGGGGAAAAPVAAAPAAATPVTPTAPVTTPVTTTLAAGTSTGTTGTGTSAGPVSAPTTTPAPVAPTAPVTAPVEAAPFTTPTPAAPVTTPVTTPAPVAPTPTVIPPGTSAVTPVETPAPLSPVDQTVIPPATSAVAPTEAGTTAAGAGTGSSLLPALAGAAAGALLAGAAGSGGSANYNAGNYPLGTALTPINPGANPGLLMGPNVVKPQLQGTGTQANYYWGGRPLIQNPGDVNNWNTQIPANTQAWGATSAQGVGANSLNISNLINDTLGLGHALSAYPGPVAPTPVQPGTTNAYINQLVNQTLNQGSMAAGGPVAPSK